MNAQTFAMTIRGLMASTAVAVALMAAAPSFADDAATAPSPAAPAATSNTTPDSAAQAEAPQAKPIHKHLKHRLDNSVDARIQTLHQQLHITAQQEPQWDAVAQIMRDNATSMRQMVSDRQTKGTSMSAVDDLRSYEAIADAHADNLKKLIPAFDALYSTMSDDQKKTADALFAHVRKPTTSHKA
jgi:hypothetical protein